MSILKTLQDGKLPPFDQLPLDRLPPAIKGKVCSIAKLIDQATLLLNAKQTFPEGIFVDSFLNSSDANKDSQDEELRKILDDLFKPLFPKENDDFDTHLKKLKARPELIFEILKIVYEESPECGQRIFNRLNEGLTQSSKE